MPMFTLIHSAIPPENRINVENDEQQLMDIEASLRQAFKANGKNNAYYLDPNEFAAEIIKCKLDNELSNRCVAMFQTLIMHIQRGWRYKDEDIQKDVAANAMLIVLCKWKQYNPMTSYNAFAFFTRVILNGLRQGWNSTSTPGINIPIDSILANDRKED